MGADTEEQRNQRWHCKNYSSVGQSSQVGGWRMRKEWKLGCPQFEGGKEVTCRSHCGDLGSSVQF